MLAALAALAVMLQASQLFRFTIPPPGADTVRFSRSFDGTRASMAPGNALGWADSLRTRPYRVRVGPGPDSVWAYRDRDFRSPLRYGLDLGRGGRWTRSNDAVAATGERAPQDTIYFRRAGCSTCFMDPIWSRNGILGWQLGYSDTEPMEIVTCEYVNTLPPIQRFGCEHFGYWCLRGERQQCPP